MTRLIRGVILVGADVMAAGWTGLTQLVHLYDCECETHGPFDQATDRMTKNRNEPGNPTIAPELWCTAVEGRVAPTRDRLVKRLLAKFDAVLTRPIDACPSRDGEN